MIDSKILNRYEDILYKFDAICLPNPGTDEEHLCWMLNQIRSHQHEDETKYHRWLGFIQGVLIMKGYTTVEAERDFTRSYFKKEKE
jgi:hypothetical protein